MIPKKLHNILELIFKKLNNDVKSRIRPNVFFEIFITLSIPFIRL
jgi:hypothetical protein